MRKEETTTFFVKEFNKFMDESNLSDAYVGEIIGACPRAVSNWRKGASCPDATRCIEILKLMKFDFGKYEAKTILPINLIENLKINKKILKEITHLAETLKVYAENDEEEE